MVYFSAQKRLTWLMINKQDELNASKVTYGCQKNNIIEDFEKIKTKVKNNSICKNRGGPFVAHQG